MRYQLYPESVADVLNLGIVVDLLRGHDELDDAEAPPAAAAAAAAVEHGHGDAAADVEVLRVADARVLLVGEVADVGRPLGHAADEDAAGEPQLGARALVGGELVLHRHRPVALEPVAAAVEPEGLPARGEHLPVADAGRHPHLHQQLARRRLRPRRDALQRAPEPLFHRVSLSLEQPRAAGPLRVRLVVVVIAGQRGGRRRRRSGGGGDAAADVELAVAGVEELGEIEPGGSQQELLHEIQLLPAGHIAPHAHHHAAAPQAVLMALRLLLLLLHDQTKQAHPILLKFSAYQATRPENRSQPPGSRETPATNPGLAS